MDDVLISFGEAVKALPNGKVGGYLVRFSSAADPDISAARDFFTKSTDFDLARNDKVTVYYDHGLDSTLKKRKLGTGEMKMDEVGVWVEAQLNLRDEYEQQIFQMAQNGKLGWSSGTAMHLVTRKAVDGANEILTWPLGLDASLTPTPAEPRNNAVGIKKIMKLGEYAQKNNARKALFEENLSEAIGVWDLASALMRSLEDIAEASDASADLSQTFDKAAAIDEVLAEFNARLRPWAERYVENCCGDESNVYMLSLDASRKSLERLSGKLENDMPIDEHSRIAETAVEGFAKHAGTLSGVVKSMAERWKARNEARIKSGRVISAANKARIDSACNTMKACADSILSCHDEMRSLIVEPVLPDGDQSNGTLSLKTAVGPDAGELARQAEAEFLRFTFKSRKGI